VSNVHIYNNKIGPCGSTYDGEGVALRNVRDVVIEKNTFDDVSSAFLAAYGTNNIVFDRNYATRIRGPFPRGQLVQFHEVTGSGNRITCNVSDQSSPGYGRGTEDHVNMYKSSGTSTSPILVKYNKIRGGGPSNSGGGLMSGDEGSSYVTIDSNILVNPGQYGVAIAGGHNNKILNNKVYSASFAWSNVGVFVWNQYAPASYGHEVSGNRVNWTDRYGKANNWWDGRNSGKLLTNNNAFGDPSITASIWDEFPVQCYRK
jgi:parallel beta-helix repeat protein